MRNTSQASSEARATPLTDREGVAPDSCARGECRQKRFGGIKMEHLQGTNKITGPHQGQRVLTAGEPLERAKAAMIMIHGRGASPEDILSLASELKQPGFTYLAPQAGGYSWYPNSFLAPL